MIDPAAPALPRHHRVVLAAVLALTLSSGIDPAVNAAQPAPGSVGLAAPPGRAGPRTPPRFQPRAHGTRIVVPPEKIDVHDGDTAVIRWTAVDAETVRFLGIDTPETRNEAHDLPYSQPFGAEARAFAQGAFAAATRVQLLRGSTLDPYRRTLGYFFLNDRNYSVLVVRARLAEESITRYGDNGFPREAAEVAAAARAAGPLPFESPAEYRRRMREVSRWTKSRGPPPRGSSRH
jgi:endonuclease YncB( thermonuclease family)